MGLTRVPQFHSSPLSLKFSRLESADSGDDDGHFWNKTKQKTKNIKHVEHPSNGKLCGNKNNRALAACKICKRNMEYCFSIAKSKKVLVT